MSKLKLLKVIPYSMLDICKKSLKEIPSSQRGIFKIIPLESILKDSKELHGLYTNGKYIRDNNHIIEKLYFNINHNIGLKNKEHVSDNGKVCVKNFEFGVLDNELMSVIEYTVKEFNTLMGEQVSEIKKTNAKNVILDYEDKPVPYENYLGNVFGGNMGLFFNLGTPIDEIKGFEQLLEKNYKTSERCLMNSSKKEFYKGKEVRIGTRTRNILVKISVYPDGGDVFKAWILNPDLEIVEKTYDKSLILDSYKKDSTVV